MSEKNGLPIQRYQANVKNVKRDDKGQYVWWKEYDFIQQQLSAANELLKRWIESVEPFPIVSDLKSLRMWLKQKDGHHMQDKKAMEVSYKKYEAKHRKLYKDTKQALKENNGKG